MLHRLVSTQKISEVESYGSGMWYVFRVGRNCDVCRTVLSEKLSVCIQGEGDSIDWSSGRVRGVQGVVMLRVYV
jgi:hypothetical protein